MRSSRFTKTDILIVLFCVAGMAAAGSLAFHSHQNKQIIASEPQSLGFVKPLGADVRVKGEDASAWNSIGRDANVFRNDRVYTGASSAAKVKLKAGQNITVEPNSLIVIDDQGKKSIVDLGMGSFLSEIKKGTHLFVRSHGHETQIESHGATLRLQSDENKDLRILVLSGEAQVQGKDQREPTVVKSNDEAVVSDKKTEVKSFSISLISPLPGEALWDKGQAVDFKWSNPNGAERVRLDVSLDPEFKSIQRTQETEDSHFALTLEPGKIYFWRVSSIQDAEKYQSPLSSFAYSALTAPKIALDATVEMESDETSAIGPLHFEWRDSMASESYEIQVSHDPNFSSIDQDFKTERAESLISGLKLGTSFWRVTSRTKGRPDLQSEVGRILVVAKAPPLTVAAKAPPAKELQPPVVQQAVPVAPMEQPPIAPEQVAQAPGVVEKPTVIEKSVRVEEPIKVAEHKDEHKVDRKAERKVRLAATSPTFPQPAQRKPATETVNPVVTPIATPMASAAQASNETTDDEPELLIRPNISYGGGFASFNQSGAFGGVNGSFVVTDAVGLNATASYGRWSLQFGLDQYAVTVATSTIGANAKESKNFKNFYLKPGYGLFFAGIDGRTAPVVRANGTDLDWSDLTTLYAVAGIRREWLFAGKRKKPFSLGTEFEAAYPVSASSDGLFSVSNVKGYGAKLNAFAEKCFVSNEALKLFIGLKAEARIENLEFDGTWAVSNGDVKREIQEYGAKLYLGAEF